MRKIISILILFAMAISILVSCSGEAPELLAFINPVEEALTFEGMEFRFGKVQEYFMDEGAVMGYVDNTGFSDAARARINELEETLDIVYKEITVDRVNDEVLLDSVTGESRFDAVQDESYYLIDGIRAGLYSDLTELRDYLDYTDSYKWGSKRVLESLCWNGGLFGVVPMAMPLLPLSSASNIVAANLDYIRSIGMPDPRTYYENGEWTWDKLKEILPLYTQRSETPEDYRYGLLCSPGWFVRAMIFSNGTSSVVKDSSGKYVPVTATEPGQRALQASFDICFGELAYTIDQESAVLDYEIVFPAGKHALSVIDAYQVCLTSKSLVYTMKNLAILPFPVGPDMPEGVTPSCSSSLDYTVSIPLGLDEPWVSATIINALYEPFEGYETEESLIDFLAGNYFSTKEDANVLMDILKNIVYGYGYIYYPEYAYGIDPKKHGSVAEFLSSNLSVAQSIIDESLVNHITSADAVFGE